MTPEKNEKRKTNKFWYSDKINISVSVCATSATTKFGENTLNRTGSAVTRLDVQRLP